MKSKGITKCLLICIFFILFQSLSFAQNIEKKRILILSSYSSNFHLTNDVIRGIQSALGNEILQFEYMDTKNTYNKEHIEKLYELYKYKFKNDKFDIIISIGNNSTKFLQNYSVELFPNTPVVFCGSFKPILSEYNSFSGVISQIDIKDTINIALKLHPNTKKLIFITDTNYTGHLYKKNLKTILPIYKNKVNFDVFEDNTVEKIEQNIKKLPKESIIIYLGILKNKYGEVICPIQELKTISSKYKVPIYTPFEYGLGHGAVGGMMINGYFEGKSVGKLALDILNQNKTNNLPIIRTSPSKYMFDYNQIIKFKIRISDLPKDSIIINNKPQFFYLSKDLIYNFIIFMGFILISTIFILLYNIYSLRKAEEKLKESEDRYRKLVEFSPYGIIVHVNNKIVFVNPSALKLLGARSNVELIGKDIFEFIHPDYYKIAEKNIQEEQCGNSIKLVEEKIIRRDGSYIDVEITATPFKYNGMFASLVIGRDITEIKNTKYLQDKIEEEERRLKEALEYDKLKTEFFSNLSHELKTPLNLIFSSTQLLELNFKNKKTENIDKSIKILRQNCYRMLRLINNLIDITKIDSGYLKLNLQNCNIINIVEDVTLSVAQYIESKNISLIFDTDIEEKIISIDPDAVERIMLNLLANSIKFTNPGDSIFVNIYDNKDHILISVKDTGIGIPKSKIKIIFDRFRQVDKSLNRNREGSGIGLSLVKSLIDMHKGEITVKSQHGKGSEFIVKLPVDALTNSDLDTKIYELNNVQNNYVEKINIEFSDIYA